MISADCTFARRQQNCLFAFLALAAGALLCDLGLAQVYGNGKACWRDAPCSVDTGGEVGAASRPAARKGAKRIARVLRKKQAAQVTSQSGGGSKISEISESVDEKVAIQIDQNDKAIMELALNNVSNIIDYYKGKGQTVAIEVVAYGPGLHMLRSDSSPVKDRIAPMALSYPRLSFVACGVTQANQSRSEGKPVTLLSEAKVVPSGVVRLIELQEQGYTYLRP